MRALTQQTTEKTAPKSKADSKPKKAKTTATASKKVFKSEEKKDVSTSSAPEEGPRTSVWLMKSEPDTFSIDALINSPDSTSHWDGVRNHEAKNLMKNLMKVGDRVLFYHSNTKEPGIVALAEIVREGYPDHTAFDPKSEYYDEKSTKEDPRWFMVDVKFTRKFKRIVTLKELQQYKDKELSGMKLLNRGRLSVQPVTDQEMDFILCLEQQELKEG
ncbi:hypothetical protein BG006_008631 [Podila minutissima]|uniref:Thymocyte nuclear protein 1 n=1 Tax=Podila minutissima TaxID=64525 RepID=A0A9P5SFM6_9FUNG|nr:hypothetical protein BG006_008631 [Podila minutissima]